MGESTVGQELAFVGETRTEISGQTDVSPIVQRFAVMHATDNVVIVAKASIFAVTSVVEGVMEIIDTPPSGADVTLDQSNFNLGVSDRETVACFDISQLAVGLHSVRLRIRRTAGTGTISSSTGNIYQSIMIYRFSDAGKRRSF